MSRYGAIILAAGFSRRLPGENKLLKAYKGKPLLWHALETVASLRLRDAVVVAGENAGAIAAQAERAGLRHVRNDDAAAGMGASISVGASAIADGLAGIFVVLGDMPAITAEDFRRLCDAHQGRTARICVPVWDGQRGHPVLFGVDYRGELAALTGDTGARDLLKRHAHEMVAVPAASARVLLDIDTAADFA